MIKIFRVYRNPDLTPGWWCEIGVSEVLVTARTAEYAKGLALKKHPSLRDIAGDRHRLLSKKDIFVEEVNLEENMILLSR